MPRQAQVLTVLIAAPGDVGRQRDVVQREVEEWNRSFLGKGLGVRVEAVRWDLDAVPELGPDDGQAVINKQLRDNADIVIGIFHSRLGTATERAASGTAEEIEEPAGRGVPVHVYVDVSDIPRDHDSVQFDQLKTYLSRLAQKGLLGEIRSDDELTRQVRRALDKDVDDFLRRSLKQPISSAPDKNQPAPLVRWRDRLNSAADAVLAAESLAGNPSVNGESEWVGETFERRRAEILTVIKPLLRVVIEAVRAGDAEVNEAWLDLVPALAQNPHMSGSTVLLELKRAPGALVFHTAGLTACAARDDALTGRLLSPIVRVDDPHKGPGPAVVSLRAELTFPSRWPSKDLAGYLVPILASVVGDRVAQQAWEQWTYLSAVAVTYFSATMPGVWVHHPYLQISDGGATSRVVVAEGIRRGVAEKGSDHPLLVGGLCDSNLSLFEEAATTFESNYGAWADQLDWQALPQGGGWLPLKPHYPGDRGA